MEGLTALWEEKQRELIEGWGMIDGGEEERGQVEEEGEGTTVPMLKEGHTSPHDRFEHLSIEEKTCLGLDIRPQDIKVGSKDAVARCGRLLLDDDDLERNLAAYFYLLQLVHQGDIELVDEWLFPYLAQLCERSSFRLTCFAAFTMSILKVVLVLKENNNYKTMLKTASSKFGNTISVDDSADGVASCLSDLSSYDWVLHYLFPSSAEGRILDDVKCMAISSGMTIQSWWVIAVQWVEHWEKEGRLQMSHELIDNDIERLKSMINHNEAELNIDDVDYKFSRPEDRGATSSNANETQEEEWHAHFVALLLEKNQLLHGLRNVVWIMFNPMDEEEVNMIELRLAMEKGIQLTEYIPDCM
eukprot:m.10651 g.10651  ORF g.10651 m.10651 type:complete len:358 (-) comp3702_c0_seq1:57-1130(-)